jgi:hypothetical protein
VGIRQWAVVLFFCEDTHREILGLSTQKQVDFLEINTAATPNASQASYSFVLSTVDKAYYDIIEAYNKETRSYSGEDVI